MEDLIKKIEKKASFKHRVGEIAEDIGRVIKNREGRYSEIKPNVVENMIKRYDAEFFRGDKFAYVGIYRSALERIENGMISHDVNVDDLKRARMELMEYAFGGFEI